MPHFTAIALDRLIDPGASRSADKTSHGSAAIRGHPLDPKLGSSPKLERRNSTSSSQRRVLHPQMTPVLYATPEATPLPDSPSSFPPSPYLINHKRRGPRLGKSQSDGDASCVNKTTDEAEVTVGTRETSRQVVDSAEDVPVAHPMSKPMQDNLDNGGNGGENGTPTKEEAARTKSGQNENLNGSLVGEDDSLVPFLLSPGAEVDGDDFYDPQESMSYTSNSDIDDHGTPDRFSRITSSGGEFYDAWEGI